MADASDAPDEEEAVLSDESHGGAGGIPLTGEQSAAQPEPTGSVMLLRLVVYWWQDSKPAGITAGGTTGPAPGRLLIEYTAFRPDDHADISLIASLRAQYQAPDVREDQREKIKDAAADYAASRVEGQLSVTWETPQSLPLTDIIDLLNGSAEWLRGMVEHPLTDISSAAGAGGPLVSIGAGITANFAMAQVTAPIENAVRICEIAGIAIGAVTGAHPLVIACMKRLAHDELGNVLARAFKGLLASTGTDREKSTGRNNSPHRRHLHGGPARLADPRGRGDRADRNVRTGRSRSAGSTAPDVPTGRSRSAGSTAPDVPTGRSRSAGSTAPDVPTGRSRSAGSTAPDVPTGRSRSAGSTAPDVPTGRSRSAGSTAPDVPTGRSRSAGSTAPDVPTGRSRSADAYPGQGGRPGRGI